MVSPPCSTWRSATRKCVTLKSQLVFVSSNTGYNIFVMHIHSLSNDSQGRDFILWSRLFPNVDNFTDQLANYNIRLSVQTLSMKLISHCMLVFMVDHAVLQVHCFGPDWHISKTIGWIGIKLCTDVYGSQMDGNDFGNLPTFPLVPPRGWHLQCCHHDDLIGLLYNSWFPGDKSYCL